MPIARKGKAASSFISSDSIPESRCEEEIDPIADLNKFPSSRPPSLQVHPPPLIVRREVDFDANVIGHHANDEEVAEIIRTQKKNISIENFKSEGVTLENAPLHANLLHNIQHVMNYNDLLPLQEYCIEILLHRSKRDLLVQSPTGSGKTAAFGIPAVQKAIESKDRKNPGPSVIIVCNTQNLALQIRDNVRLLVGEVPHSTVTTPPQRLPVNVFGMFKGGNDDRRLSIDNQPDLVVATMGILLRCIENNRLKLGNLRLLVVDEADKMLKEGGFAREMRQLLDGINTAGSTDCQVAAFSATFSDFEDMYGNLDLENESFGTAFYKPEKPVIVKVEGVKGYITQRIIKIEEEIHHPNSEIMSNACKRAEYTRLCVRSTIFAKKFGYLCALLDEDKDKYFVNGVYTKTAVVFVGRITTSNFLATMLLLKGYKVAPLNSNYDLVAVTDILNKLKKGEIQAVISTNKLARGQDIPDLHHVIIYEMAHEFDDYKHRIGRTGRIGKGGISTALLSRQDKDHCANLYYFLLEHRQKIPNWLVQVVEDQHDAMAQYAQ